MRRYERWARKYILTIPCDYNTHYRSVELDCVVFNMQKLGIMLVLLLALATVIDAARNEARTPEGNFVDVEARGCLGQNEPCYSDGVRQVSKFIVHSGK